jgi:cell division protein FtsL
MENGDSPKADVPEAQQIGSDAGRPKMPEAEKTQQDASAQLQQVEKELSKYERSSLKWMKLTIVVYALTCAFIALQWYEMKMGSSDTHDLAVAAKNQATEATAQVNKLSALVQQTTKEAASANRLVVAAQGSVKLAERALDASNKLLEATNKFYSTNNKFDSTMLKNEELDAARDDRQSRAILEDVRVIESRTMDNPTLSIYAIVRQNPIEGHPLSVSVVVYNYGSWPAIDARMITKCYVKHDAIEVFLDRKTVADLPAPLGGAGTVVQQNGGNFGQAARCLPLLSAEDIRQIKTHKFPITITGDIYYRNTSDALFHTEFCKALLSGNGLMSTCLQHNHTAQPETR